MTEPDVNHVLRAYVDAALWSSTDDDGDPLDGHYDVLDMTVETLREMLADVESFVAANLADLTGLSADAIGLDFWLTRNRHGAGFWDRGLGERGDRLTAATRPYGGCDLYVGDDGRLHCQ